MNHSSQVPYESLFLDSSDYIWVISASEKNIYFLSKNVREDHNISENCIPLDSLSKVMHPSSFQQMMNGIEKRTSRFLAGDRSNDVIYENLNYAVYGKDGMLYTYETSSHLQYNTESGAIQFFGISHRNSCVQTTKNFDTNSMFQSKNILANCEQIKVYFFGQFLVYGPRMSNPVKWRTAKTEELFAFILCSDQHTISKGIILETLWPEVYPQKSSEYLHTTLYYLKKNLYATGIDFQAKYYNGCYSFTLPALYSDVSEFTRILQDNLHTEEKLGISSIFNLVHAHSLYTDHFLGQNAFSWAISKKLLYENMYKTASMVLIKHYYKEQNYTNAKKIIYKFLLQDNLDETVHEYLLRIFT